MKTYDGQRRRYAQVKVDGHLLRVVKDELGRVACVTRTPRLLDLRWHPLLATAHSRLPRGVTLLGELWLPGRRASAVKTALRDRDLSLRFSPFAVATGPADLSLEHVEHQLTLWGFTDLLHYWSPLETPEEDHDFAVKLMGDDAEGVVYKDGNWANEAKWKPTLTADLVVTGVNEGEGRLAGLVGSLECALADGRVVADVGGMSDEERAEMTADSPVGKVVEVAYQRVDSRGRLRHPRFVRLRDDKRAEECTEI